MPNNNQNQQGQRPDKSREQTDKSQAERQPQRQDDRSSSSSRLPE